MSNWGWPNRDAKVSKTGVGSPANKSSPATGSPGSKSVEEDNEVADDASVGESDEGERKPPPPGRWGEPNRFPNVGSSGQKSTPAKSIGSSGREGAARRMLPERDARKETRTHCEEEFDSDDVSLREAVVVYGPVDPACCDDGDYTCLEDNGKCTVIGAARSALKRLKVMGPLLSEYEM
jgi:hypothetical protein